MNLETTISADLWDELKRSYSESRYSDAIRDAVLYMSEVIRTKSGLEGDGVALVGQAFGGASPKIRVSRMETQSEKDVQAGIESLMRGIYQGIRNPRHHGKINDIVDDADAIILFIDYLVRMIGKAKAQFAMTDCLKHIFDDAFVGSAEYAELIVSEIPQKYRRDVFVETFQKLDKGKPEKLRSFFEALFKVLTPVEIDEALDLISRALRTASKNEIQPILGVIRVEDWINLDKIARLRTESILIESMQEGEYVSSTGRCTGGALATWGGRFVAVFDDKLNVYSVLRNGLLSDNQNKRQYIGRFFGSFSDLLESPTEWDIKLFCEGLDAGKQEVYDHLHSLSVFSVDSDPWVKPFIEAMAKFRPKENTAPVDEDVPF